MATKITIAGKINDPYFHKAITLGRHLQLKHPDLVHVECLQFFETQWSQFMKKIANNLKGVFYDHDETKTLIYLNDNEYIGDGDQFSQWVLYKY